MTYPNHLFFRVDDTARGKRVVIRIDINTTLSADNVPLDTARIDAASDVLTKLSKSGARVVALAHYGEKGETLLPLATFLSKKVPGLSFVQGVDQTVIKEKVANISDGEILLLENVRCFEGETGDDDSLADFFASLGECYINDAFPVSHRKHASVTGVPRHLPSYFGPIIQRELENLTKALTPEFPCLLILGGAKLSTKLPLIEVYLKKGCFVYVGGAMVHNILKAKGYEIGTSLYDKDYIVPEYVLQHEKLILPSDVILDDFSVVPVNAVPQERKIYDCGENTLLAIKDIASRCHTAIMNGPVGYYEGGFMKGTEGILREIEASGALTSIIGGGDTLTVYNAMEQKPKLSFVSLGGGAMLDFLKDGILPGVEAVVKSHNALP